MPNYGEQTWPDIFSPSVADRLVEIVPGLTRDRVFSSAHSEEIHLLFPPGADKFITLFMPHFPVDQAAVSGGGIYTTPFNSRLVSTAFVRVEADIEGRDGKWLEDEAFGVYKFVQKIITALQTWPGPIAASGRQLFREPMRINPGFDIKSKGGVKGSRWGVAAINWEISFVADLGTNYPGG